MAYWIYAEDLASALIGPFGTEGEADDHVKFCEVRGDGAEMQVLTGFEAGPLQGTVGMTLTPEEDRAYGEHGAK